MLLRSEFIIKFSQESIFQVEKSGNRKTVHQVINSYKTMADQLNLKFVFFSLFDPNFALLSSFSFLELKLYRLIQTAELRLPIASDRGNGKKTRSVVKIVRALQQGLDYRLGHRVSHARG